MGSNESRVRFDAAGALCSSPDHIARAVGAPKVDKHLPGYLDRAQIDLLFQMAEARAMGATCGGVRVWSLYVPNGRAIGDPHLEYKLRWLAALLDAGVRIFRGESGGCDQRDNRGRQGPSHPAAPSSGRTLTTWNMPRSYPDRPSNVLVYGIYTTRRQTIVGASYELRSFDAIYRNARTIDDVYEAIADRLIRLARRHRHELHRLRRGARTVQPARRS